MPIMRALSSIALPALVSALLVAAAAMPAAASEAAAVEVTVNMARVLRINAPAATVIIGNPGVADVTIQDPQTLVLTGKSFGRTNLIVLDEAGNPIADTKIEVVQTHGDFVTVYLGAARTTLTCNPTCQPTIMLGDDNAFTSASAASSSIVESAAR